MKHAPVAYWEKARLLHYLLDLHFPSSHCTLGVCLPIPSHLPFDNKLQPRRPSLALGQQPPGPGEAPDSSPSDIRHSEKTLLSKNV